MTNDPASGSRTTLESVICGSCNRPYGLGWVQSCRRSKLVVLRKSRSASLRTDTAVAAAAVRLPLEWRIALVPGNTAVWNEGLGAAAPATRIRRLTLPAASSARWDKSSAAATRRSGCWPGLFCAASSRADRPGRSDPYRSAIRHTALRGILPTSSSIRCGRSWSGLGGMPGFVRSGQPRGSAITLPL